MESKQTLMLIVMAIGFVFFIEGIPYFLFPHRVINFYKNIQNMPEKFLRVFGFLAMLMGLIIVYIAKGVF